MPHKKPESRAAEATSWTRGYYCAVAALLREEGTVTTAVSNLFAAGGDWRKADPYDIALFEQHGLTTRNE
ncbi:hypothetical protein POK33_37975 [Burkholderia cenocepacia]|uniref:hypothetical protein n=1 Tax=Burkholderia cenocepacia TaxID=95486 RepID=UPI0023B9452C|nr:hypothetical protein [Burkholderia cenocepacia]MDF0506545.1 hypothetical protein [Burkholderia cenocepacia]